MYVHQPGLLLQHIGLLALVVQAQPVALLKQLLSTTYGI